MGGVNAACLLARARVLAPKSSLLQVAGGAGRTVFCCGMPLIGKSGNGMKLTLALLIAGAIPDAYPGSAGGNCQAAG